jgi:hypothetical protein
MRKMLRVLPWIALVCILALGTVSVSAAPPQIFITHLSGDEEVPPVDTKAQGLAVFRLNKDSTELHYKLIVANIENVVQAHIHVAPAGVNGPVVAFLYPNAPPPVLIPGRSNGVLAEGTITSADLVGPLAGMSLEDLLDEMRSGNTYVNVHTSQFPMGEMRGQIRTLVPAAD